ncbi:MBOAT family O-acyltransferase [Flavobacterium sp.]|jgi:D-alanyl-lipoteichoic acid acyltransferase DltB (MBOAT superfamily)|uniref:MBOAT family O-acyltransferase n=1 Tax=Flavobacterium sp. TaxID=239 RepID=UPI0037C09687
MLFNSLDFAFFLPIVFVLYWFFFAKALKWQNVLLLAASYYFYSCWDWRFLFLLIFSTALDYYSGHKIAQSLHHKKKWLILSVGINLGFLGVFKYYNFFVESFADFLGSFGIQQSYSTLNVILPVGISFYTFHGLSYVFDVYNNKIKPCDNWVNYSLFVSFFPLLVAGPIERATHLLPQVEKPRTFDYGKAIDGLRQILWGLFKKMVIADNCAKFANVIFENSADETGSTLALGALFFTFQIYCDFSGYSDIALGTARLFGFELLQNFKFPYFSRDIAEFWRRWHISLSSWFRDYLYFPLGGSQGSIGLKVRNTFIIFLVSGFWHGANWTFIVWGLLNAIYFLPLLLANKNRVNLDVVAQGRYLPNLKEVFQMTVTFSLTVIAWIFFRANDLSHAFQYLTSMFTEQLFTMPTQFPIYLIVLLAFFITVEWLGRANNFAIQKLGFLRFRILRWGFYTVLLFLIFTFMVTEETPFIYFQF